MEYNELIELEQGELAIFHRDGVDKILAEDFLEYDETMQVDYGEQGKSFKIYFVLDCHYRQYTHLEAQQIFDYSDEKDAEPYDEADTSYGDEE